MPLASNSSFEEFVLVTISSPDGLETEMHSGIGWDGMEGEGRGAENKKKKLAEMRGREMERAPGVSA